GGRGWRSPAGRPHRSLISRSRALYVPLLLQPLSGEISCLAHHRHSSFPAWSRSRSSPPRPAPTPPPPKGPAASAPAVMPQEARRVPVVRPRAELQPGEHPPEGLRPEEPPPGAPPRAERPQEVPTREGRRATGVRPQEVPAPKRPLRPSSR